MAIKAIIFDLDGTLLDTLQDLADSFNFALQKYNYPIHAASEYRYFVGDGAQKAMERALPESARRPDQVKKVLALFADHYSKNFDNLTRPFAGIPELMQTLKARGLTVAVLSNKPHPFTVQCVDAYFNGLVDFTHGVLDDGLKKPDARVINAVVEEIAVPRAEILYVGDTGTDMQTAVNGQLTGVGVTWGFRDEEELRRAGATHIIDKPEQLLALL